MDTIRITSENLWLKSWELLKRGAVDKVHDFNLGVLCSLTPTLHPRSRTLVLRKVMEEEGELWCYTDRRSAKALSINAGRNAICWTFWSPRHHLQVTASGNAHWLEERESRTIFASLPKHSRKAYATIAPPGSPSIQPTDGLPDDWEQRDLSATDYAAVNFGVLITQLTEVEVLHLSREGNQRLQASREGSEPWRLEWLVP